ncbi:type IV pilin [Halorientalis salina]|uniref:type IV pilin n=1 Tax=Halorientalis salina TaxID=2932266 RepID=UPI0010ABF073|nr:type IV pilin [Halorientalis salina]
MSGDRGPIDSLVADRRGVTINNTAAVATLLVFTVLIGGGLGAAVLFAEEDDTGPPGGNFTYEYFDDNDALLVTFDEGDEFEAGEVLLTNGDSNATWATVAGSNNTTALKPGDSIQLSRGSAFGDTIGSSDRVRIYWTGGNETIKLDEWNSSDSSGF